MCPPLYEFYCNFCETLIESLEDIDTQEIECPNCKSKAERQMSRPGWYNINGAHDSAGIPRWKLGKPGK